MPYNKGGLYFIFVKGSLVYIGRTKNLRRRIRNNRHHIFEYLDDSGELRDCVIKYKVTDRDLPTREKRLIRRFKPLLNDVCKY